LGSGSGISRISSTSGPPNPVLRIARIGISAGMYARNLHDQTIQVTFAKMPELSHLTRLKERRR
jgi:hypothetical protein